MARLVIKPGSPIAREIQLKSGANSIGRAAANDFQIPDASVSGSHCQLLVSDHTVAIKDLGSTNGTFINRAQIREAVLQNGQTLRLGEVEMIFYSDVPAAANAPGDSTTPLAFAVPQQASSGTQQALTQTESFQTATPVAVSAVRPAPEHNAFLAVTLPPPPSRSPMVIGTQFCRFHPKSAARYLCGQCQHFFCEACVALRKVGGVPRKFCRHCGAECTAVQVQLQPEVEKGFFQRLPGAFGYPLRGAGVFLVLAGIIIFAMVELGFILVRVRTLRTVMFGCIMIICAGGYLFTYLQSILHSTAAEDKEMPDLPGVSNFAEDVVFPFFRLLGLTLLCFGPALGTAVWLAVTHQPQALVAFVAAAVFGGLYFPMAFLAVAILDSLAVANPIVVVSSILKVPVEYLLALVALAVAFGTDYLGGVLIQEAFPDAWQTTSMAMLFGMIALKVFLAFLTMYLLLVAVHILGLVFAASKETLGWLSH